MPHPRFDAERCLRETLAALAGDRDAGGARAARAARRDGRVQGGDQGGRRAVARRDARAVRRARRHDAARARRARPLDDRAALVGRARAPLWPTVARAAIPRHLRPDGGGQDARSRCGSPSATDVTIVSADSRQVYRGFDIGTAKPTAAERDAVPHCGIDVARSDRALRRRRGGRTSADGWIREARAQRTRADRRRGNRTLSARAVRRAVRGAAARRGAARGARSASCRRYSTRELRRWARELDPARAHLGRTQLLRASRSRCSPAGA